MQSLGAVSYEVPVVLHKQIAITVIMVFMELLLYFIDVSTVFLFGFHGIPP